MKVVAQLEPRVEVHDAVGSALDHLEGALSGERYEPDQLMRLDPSDNRPLLARYALDRVASTLTPTSLPRRRPGLWRWRELLPVRDDSRVISLGEGGTALLTPTRFAAHVGIAGLQIKAEGNNPTGSFKARGMSVAVSRNVELGAPALLAPTAGNAGVALAAYGAAAGVEVTVLMPADSARAHRDAVLACGARLVLVEGLISDCGRVGAAIAARTGAFDVSTMKEPYRVEGKKTMGLELAEQLDWRLPDVVVYPTGGGTGLVGMWKAFAELEQLGFIGADRPRLVSAQPAGCAPIVRAFDSGARFATTWDDANTRASGLRVPASVGDFLVLDALRASQGVAIAVDEAEIDQAQLDAGRYGLGYVSPESAAALAAAAELRADGWIAAADHVVVFDTGSGASYPPPAAVPDAVVIDPDHLDVDELLARLDGPG